MNDTGQESPAERDHPPIERLILANGWRGIERVARYLPPDYAARAARALWDHRARVLITTGFYVGGHPETDGPPGAYFLGRALSRFGAAVGFVADADPLALLAALHEQVAWGAEAPPPEFLPFPILDAAASRTFAAALTGRWRPSAVVAIERCSRTRGGQYLNFRRVDISPWTAQVDDLLAYPDAVTVGIGDGGNEIGMGSLAAAITAELGIPEPAATPAQYPVLATVSNWGAYGLIAYLSRLAGRDLLPADAEEIAGLDALVANGAVNGVSGRAEPIIDGFAPEIQVALLARLRGVIRET